MHDGVPAGPERAMTAQPLTTEAIGRLRLRLEQRRGELASRIASTRADDRPVAPDKAIGRLTRQDALQQQQMSAEIVRRAERELARVDRALGAIDGGTYGICRRCEEPIAEARLIAVPDALFCVPCSEGPRGPS